MKYINENINSSPLKYIKESKENENGFIGIVSGTGANYLRQTRNGRRYPLELWENVEKSSEFIEMMETRTCFSELDHPDERVETKLEQSAGILLDYEIDRNSGKVLVKIGILNTEKGKIVKALLDAGASVGVSSRGLGDELSVNGETIVDPDTYEFFAFDFVGMPAVKGARPQLTESIERNKTIEELKYLVKNINDKDSLNSVKRIIESCELPKSKSIISLIENKIVNLGGGTTMPVEDKLSKRLGNKTLEEKLSDSNTMVNELTSLVKNYRTNSSSMRKSLISRKVECKNLSLQNKELSDNNKFLKESYRKLRKHQLSSLDEIKSLRAENTLLSSHIDYSKRKLSKLRKENKSFKESNKILEETIENFRKEAMNSSNSLNKTINELKEQIKILEKENRNLNEDKERLERKLDLKESKLDKYKTESIEYDKKEKKLIKENDSKVKALEESNKKLAEKYSFNLNKKNEKLEKAMSYIKETNEKYLKLKCSLNGIDYLLAESELPKNYTIKDIDKKVEELVDRELRFKKIPINLSQMQVVTESKNNKEMSVEEQQTFRFLQQTIK